MLFKRYYDEQLAQASYMIACQGTGEALVVDPHRDILLYIDDARKEGVRIVHVTETHIHADYVSGSLELSRAANALLHLSDEGGTEWRYTFAAREGARLLKDGDEIAFGRVRVRAWHTPGHTPEHMSFLVTDLAAAAEPLGILSGDFIFVGDVGRPDLLEKAAGAAGTMDAAARTLFRSLQRVRDLPDYLQIWPGHGAGSACGKALGAMPQSTLGFERISNWAFRIDDEETFVREVLAGQVTPPRYFATMKRVNKEGPAILGGMNPPPRLDAAALSNLLANGGSVIDTRPLRSFAAEHLRGALSIPFNRSFLKWAGSMLGEGEPFALLVDDGNILVADVLARDLTMIGFDALIGYCTMESVRELARSGVAEMEGLSRLAPRAAAALVESGKVFVLDVRDPHELADGSLPHSVQIPLSALPSRLAELPVGAPLLVYCAGGSRSAIAASLLRRAGTAEVHDLQGGYAAYIRAVGEGAERAASPHG